MSEPVNNNAEGSKDQIRSQADVLIAEGKKAIALRQWDQGVAKYADALSLMRQLVGEFDPAMAPLLLSYGKALYELAFSQQGVMGKEDTSKQQDELVHNAVLAEEADPADAPASERFVFEGAEVEAEGEETAADAEAEAEPTSGEPEDEEPEDDYNAAWEVLDVARTIYQKQIDELTPETSEEKTKDLKLYLAECYLTLGDVSSETENFPQAVKDYSTALDIKTAILPSSSREIASAHYQLATVLEFTPDGREAALEHVQKAADGFKARRDELKATEGEDADRKAEIAEADALLGDLEVKIEELKNAPPPTDVVTESIDHLLGNGPSNPEASSSKAPDGPVNNLNSMVRKKPVKRKAEEPAASSGEDKKAKVEDAAGPSV